MMYRDSHLKKRLTSKFLTLLVTSAVLLAVIPVQSQDKKKTDDVDEVIKITANLVSVDVMVKDKKGKAITDLKAQDFILSENGVRQNIEFFDSTLVGEETNPTGTGEASDKQERPPGLPRNIIALVLDGQTTHGSNLKQVRNGMTKYIRERITASHSVAVFAISGGLQLLQPFTQDKARLIKAVENADGVASVSKSAESRGINEAMAALRAQLAGAPTGEGTSPAGGRAAAPAMISRRALEADTPLRSALSSQQTRPILAGSGARSEGIRAVPGEKAVVLSAHGFVAPQNRYWQVQSTIDSP